MFDFIKNIFRRKGVRKNGEFGTGAFRDTPDERDHRYEPIAMAGEPVDWEAGYDVEKDHNFKIPIKNQDGSSSCVGQGWAYYIAVLDAVETGVYDENSAKAIYSQIFLPGGGAYIREGAKLAVNWGSLRENIVPSYQGNNPPNEAFMREIGWKTPQADRLAKILQSREYKTFNAAQNMEMFAQAIRDNHGVVSGLEGVNNGTWSTGEPKPPTGRADWAHCIYFGKYGVDKDGKYIATPNSWGSRGVDSNHKDGWQKIRQEWFDSTYMFNPWTLVDKPNDEMSEGTKKIMANNEKKIIIEAQGAGRKGVVVNGELREILDPTNNRATAACLYALANNGLGQMVTTETFDNMAKGKDF